MKLTIYAKVLSNFTKKKNSMKKKVSVSAGLRSKAEQEEGKKNKKIFYSNPTDWEIKLENFPKYVKRQNLTRFLALYEIFKKALAVKGSIIECGVNQGFGLMTWAKLSAILEPINLTRRIYGFDTFDGFPKISKSDLSNFSKHVKKGDLKANTFDELIKLIEIYDSSRFLGHVNKVKLIKGDANKTIPLFLKNNPHLLISLLFLDFDLYEPTKVAIKHFLPRMPKGAILAFDELDNPQWPGETLAMLEYHIKRPLRLERFDFDPFISFAVLD
jgi:hypothetical protein